MYSLVLQEVSGLGVAQVCLGLLECCLGKVRERDSVDKGEEVSEGRFQVSLAASLGLIRNCPPESRGSTRSSLVSAAARWLLSLKTALILPRSSGRQHWCRMAEMYLNRWLSKNRLSNHAIDWSLCLEKVLILVVKAGLKTSSVLELDRRAVAGSEGRSRLNLPIR